MFSFKSEGKVDETRFCVQLFAPTQSCVLMVQPIYEQNNFGKVNNVIFRKTMKNKYAEEFSGFKENGKWVKIECWQNVSSHQNCCYYFTAKCNFEK